MSGPTTSSTLARVFQILVVLQLVILIGLSPIYGAFLDMAHRGDTPIDVAGNDAAFLQHEAFVLILLVVYVVAYVGLLRFKPWARVLLPIAMLLSVLEPVLYKSDFASNGIEDTIGSVSDYIDGALFTLAWASEVRLRFMRSAVTRLGTSAGA